MRWLLFLSRVAFICNLFFLIAVSLQLTNWLRNPDLISTIVIIGYALMLLFNPAVNACYLLIAVFGKKLKSIVPVWLIVANLLFLVIQCLYIIYLNNAQYS
jgi:hypothetical protein